MAGWTVQRDLLVGDLNRQINRASRAVSGGGDPLLDHIDTLQRFKRALLRATDKAIFDALVEEWHALDQRTAEEV